MDEAEPDPIPRKRGFVHGTLPDAALLLGSIALLLKAGYFLFLEFSISGGLAHMGIQPWAPYAYAGGFWLIVTLYRKHFRPRDLPTGIMLWARTVSLLVAGIVAIMCAARGIFL